VRDIGLHNGHTIISPNNDLLTFQLQEDTDDRDILYTSEISFDLMNYYPHEYTAIVMYVEYDIGVPLEKESQYNKHNTINSTIQKKNFSITTINMGSAMYVICDGKQFYLRNTEISNQSNNNDNDEVGVEIMLDTNEICQLLTPQLLIYKDEILKRNKYLVSSHRDDEENESDNEDGNNDSVMETPQVSFDIKLYDSEGIEVKHLENLADRLEEGDDDGDDARDARKPPSKYRKPPKSIQSTGRKRVPDDDDTMSVSEASLVVGSSVASSLRLDANYYVSDSESNFASPRRTQHARQYPDMETRNPSSSTLFKRSLQTQLAPSGKQNFPSRNELLDDNEPDSVQLRHVSRGNGRTEMNSLTNNLANKTVVAMTSASSHVRDISRGARSKLNRHGFSDAIEDSAVGRGIVMSDAKKSYAQQVVSAPKLNKNTVVDVELETRDKLQLHEINIQFAGMRCATRGTKDAGPTHTYMPKTVFFSYQFFTCRPTRTELMRLLPNDHVGEINVLVRDETRNETPLTLRHSIDCSSVSLTESIEFAEYLAYKTLHIDVWDADSLLLIGSACVPLRRLMRQGESIAKCSLECDIIDCESGARSDVNGIQTSVVMEGGPILGNVVGSVQILLANYGQKGLHKYDHNKINNVNQYEGLNWRTNGGATNANKSILPRGLGLSRHARPNHSVRARPLSESAPELSHALEDLRYHSMDGKSSMRSLSAIRGNEAVHTLTYDDVVTLFKRFQGTVKGTIQYSGSLMQLLDIPSYAIASRKLIKAYKIATGRGENVEKVL
jgi:hypothetical protein